MGTNHHARSSLARKGIASIAALVVAVGLQVPATGASAAEPNIIRDGSSQLSAAASCWEVKQTSPSLPSGNYWLMTPSMPAPEQFYCDQVTDGGGWVLVGRGREGWKELYEGVGTTAQVRGNVTGPAAFTVRQLSSPVIDDLLNHSRPEDLQDGIRLRRALDITGTNWQEVRFDANKRERWTWAFSSETPVASYSFNSTNGSGGTTASFGLDQNFQRVVTSEASAQNWTQGWAFGSLARGTNSAGSYVWSATATAGNPRPFTQMFIRPRLTQQNAGFADIANAGTPRLQQRSMQRTGAEATVWGVGGLASGSGELNTEVQTFAQIGNTVFVGGNFSYVQRNSAGLGRVQQSYVAGFNVNTGELVTSFRPTFNNEVKELVALPNGLLVAGGEFTTANGQPASGIVALNPVTGAVAGNWNTRIINRLSGQSVQVRAMSVQGNWLYIGGNFTHLTGGTETSEVYARGATRVSVQNGTPDRGWNPNFNGTVTGVDASDDGGRLYASGYFTMSNTSPASKAAAIRTLPGAQVIPWTWVGSAADRSNFQFGVAEHGGRVWLGGSEHNLFSFNPNGFQRLSSNITRAGGDFQDVTAANGLIYAGCHCGHWNYTNGTQWPGPGPAWTIADKINLLGIWDASTGDYLPAFNPVWKGRGGYGVWGSFVDSTGTLWSGGDTVSSVRVNGASQWSGGFARFALNDSTAPSTPGNVRVSNANGIDTVSWSSASGSPSAYHVLRGDRVVATTTSTSVQLPQLGGGRYFVRAADSSGNLSASSPVVVQVPSGP